MAVAMQNLMHLKGVAVFCKSTILLCLNALMLMFPHDLVASADHFQLNLSPEPALTEPTGSSYPLLVFLQSSLYGHFICVQASDAVPGSIVNIRIDHMLPG